MILVRDNKTAASKYFTSIGDDALNTVSINPVSVHSAILKFLTAGQHSPGLTNVRNQSLWLMILTSGDHACYLASTLNHLQPVGSLRALNNPKTWKQPCTTLNLQKGNFLI